MYNSFKLLAGVQFIPTFWQQSTNYFQVQPFIYHIAIFAPNTPRAVSDTKELGNLQAVPHPPLFSTVGTLYLLDKFKVQIKSLCAA